MFILRSLLLLLVSVIIVVFKKRRSLQENLILAILRNLVLKKRAFGVVQVQCSPLDIVLNVEGCVVAFLWLRCKALTAEY